MSEFQPESTTVRLTTDAQRTTLISMGVSIDDIPRERTAASSLITKKLGERARASEPTEAQFRAAGALGGVDLPGATRRDKANQIAMLTLLREFDLAADDDAASDVAQRLLDTVRGMFMRPGFVNKAKPEAKQETAQAPVAEAAPF